MSYCDSYMPLGDEARMPQCPDLVLELVDNLIVISGDVLDAELVVFHGVRERSVRELQKPPVLEDEAAVLQSSVAAHKRFAVDV